MTTTEPRSSRPLHDEMRAWIIERVSYYLPDLAGRIGPQTALAGLGLDSVYAVALCGEIEDTWLLTVEPTLIWDVDTVEALAERVLALIAEQHPA
ncbi:acyl carrier protein [Streptomyces sp. NBC_01235]|uniref:acyl carrier protein n=1 Tax=Streptomyces sp. NBC_01235 TaxID=2903788 RepID=UPI002E1403CF|nr:acyl carrier protein [Streptomyces sp. NBC_01235]